MTEAINLSDPRSLEELEVVYIWTSGRAGQRPGSFHSHLIAALFAADCSNFAKLAAAFPEYAEAVRRVIDQGVVE